MSEYFAFLYLALYYHATLDCLYFMWDVAPIPYCTALLDALFLYYNSNLFKVPKPNVNVVTHSTSTALDQVPFMFIIWNMYSQRLLSSIWEISRPGHQALWPSHGIAGFHKCAAPSFVSFVSQWDPHFGVSGWSPAAAIERWYQDW